MNRRSCLRFYAQDYARKNPEIGATDQNGIALCACSVVGAGPDDGEETRRPRPEREWGCIGTVPGCRPPEQVICRNDSASTAPRSVTGLPAASAIAWAIWSMGTRVGSAYQRPICRASGGASATFKRAN